MTLAKIRQQSGVTKNDKVKYILAALIIACFLTSEFKAIWSKNLVHLGLTVKEFQTFEILLN